MVKRNLTADKKRVTYAFASGSLGDRDYLDAMTVLALLERLRDMGEIYRVDKIDPSSFEEIRKRLEEIVDGVLEKAESRVS